MERTSLLHAILAIIDNNNYQICGAKSGNLSQNGKGLEEFIIRAFSNSFLMDDEEYTRRLHEVYSYLGSAHSPPDAMIRGGAAIEIKKIGAGSQYIQFNSSMPKHVLRSTDPMLTEECRNAEVWDRKSMIYAIGIVNEDILRHLFFVYGVDYCALNSCERVTRTLKTSIRKITDLVFEDTNELGRINNIDPYGNTYLRMRGMWVMKTPWKVFGITPDNSKSFTMTIIVNDRIWSAEKELSGIDEDLLVQKGLSIENYSIKNPDDSQVLVPGKLISYSISND